MGFFGESLFFGAALSLGAYGVGCLFHRKLKLALFNPLLLSVVIVIGFLAATSTDYAAYSEGAEVLSCLLTPATVCLAVPLYEKRALLRRYWKAILAGIVSGALTSLCCVLAMAAAFGLSHEEYVTLLPKSVTTAIGMGVAEELGGYGSLAAAVIILTGVLGNMIAPAFCRLCRIREPIAQGVAVGTSAHAIGTAKAMEMGETQGAMSSLSIVVSGLVTVVGASIFAQFL